MDLHAKSRLSPLLSIQEGTFDALLDRHPGSGNSANATERDAAAVFGNRVARKKKSRPEHESCQNQCGRTAKYIHTKENHGAISRKQSVERNFGPMIHDCGRYQQQERDHAAAKNGARRIRQPHHDCAESGERNRDRIKTFSFFADGYIGVAPTTRANTKKRSKPIGAIRDKNNAARRGIAAREATCVVSTMPTLIVTNTSGCPIQETTTARRRARIHIGQDRQSECRQNFSGDFTETDAIAIAIAPACDRESVTVFEPFAGFISR